MKMMKFKSIPRFVAVWATGVAAVLGGCSENGETVAKTESARLPMPTGKATVTEGLGSGDVVTNCIPERRGNVITALNKRMEIDPRSGRLTLVIDNETAWTCGESYCFIDAERGLKHYGVFSKDCERRWLSRVRAYETNGAYVTEAYLKTSAGGEYLQHRTTLAVLPDGLIRATSEGRPSQDEKVVKITNPGGLFFGGGQNVLPGSLAEFGGTVFSYDEQPQLELPVPKNAEGFPITYYSGNPALQFKVTLGKGIRGQVGWGVWTKGSVHGCFDMPGVKTIFIDLRRGVKRAENPNVRGGIDWRAVENLEMPERRKNLFGNGSFERGWRCWDSGRFGYGGVSPRRWNTEYFAIDDRVAHSGRRSLRCFAPACGRGFPHGFGEASIATSLCPVPEPGRYTISFWAKAASPDVLACVMCPAFSYEVGRSSLNRWESKSKEMGGRFRLATEWTRHSFSFDIPKADPFKLVFVFWTTKGERGMSAWIDDVQFETGGEPTAYERPAAEAELVMSDPDQFCELGEPLRTKLNVFADEPGEVKVEVKSFLDEPIFEKTFAFAPTDGCATVAVPELEGSLPGPGVFKMKRTYRLASGKTAFEHDRFTVAKSLDNVPRKWRFLQSDYGEPFVNETAVRELKRFRRIGIDRLYGPRSGYNPTVRAFVASNGLDCGTYRIAGGGPGELYAPDPKNPKRKVRRGLKGANISSADIDLAHPGGDYSVTNTPGVNVFLLSHLQLGVPMDEAYLKRVEEAAAAKVARYPYITHWECSSEINCALGYEAWSSDNDWDRQMRNFSKWLAAVYRGAKKANPRAVVSNDSPMNMSPSCIEEIKATMRYCAAEGVKFDAIGAHTYRYSPESPDLDEGFKTLLETARSLGYPENVGFQCGEGMHWGPYEVRAWGLQSSNWGGCPARWWDPPSALSYDIGRTEIRSAAWRARSWLVAYKYARRMQEMNSGNTNNFELDANGTPFLSQLVSSVLVNLLGSADFVEDIRFAPYCRAYVFTDGKGRGIAAMWSHKSAVDEGREDAPVASADFGDALETVRDMMGSRRAFAGRGDFAVTPQPLYFISRPGRTADLVRAVKSLRVAARAGVRGDIAYRPSAPDATAVTVWDFKGVASNGVERISPPLVADEVRTVRVTSLGTSYPAFLIPHVGEKATAATIDWSKIPVQKLANRCGKPGRDFAATQQLAWNRAALYLRVTVTDPTFLHVGTVQASQRYDNDSLQVFLDAGANARFNHRKGFDDDDYAYDVLPESDGRSAKVYRRRSPDMQLTLGVYAPKDGVIAGELPVAFEKTPEGYVYTLTMPAKYVLPLRLEKGRAVGIGLFVSDANDATRPQGKRTEGSLTNLTVPGKGPYQHPERWPVALLWN